MKALFILIFFPLFNSPPIPYRQLTWSDFKGKPTNDHAASTCTGIVIERDTAYAIFEPEESWTRTNNSKVLQHEQLHFKITARWAKIMADYLSVGDKEMDYYFWRWREEEERYDKDTNHGLDTIQQRIYEEQIKL